MLEFDVIIYHLPCSDGTAALWSACHYKDIPKKIGIRAGTDPEFKFNNKNILFTDICPSLEFIVNTSDIAKNIVIIDHHKSAQDMYNKNKNILDTIKNINIVFDMNKSGCQLTWDYFFPTQSRPWFIDYIGDRDLWKWELHNSKEINTALYELNYIDNRDLSKLTNLLDNHEDKLNELFIQGKLISQLHKKELDNAVYKAIQANLKINDKIYKLWLGGNITMSLRSELGNLLSVKKFNDGTKPDFAAIWVYEPKLNEWWISLRGCDDSPDLSNIATHFGGGGHSKASGFSIKNNNTLKDIFIIN